MSMQGETTSVFLRFYRNVRAENPDPAELIRQLLEMTKDFDDPEAEVPGADFVEWFADCRQDLKMAKDDEAGVNYRIAFITQTAVRIADELIEELNKQRNL